MAGRPHARLARGGAVDGGDAPPGSNGRPAPAGSAVSGKRSGGPIRSQSRRATSPIGRIGSSSQRPDAGAGAAGSALADHGRPRPDRGASPGAEPAGVDQARAGRRRAADGGARLEGSIRTAWAGDGTSNPVRGRRPTGRLSGPRRIAARDRAERASFGRDVRGGRGGETAARRGRAVGRGARGGETAARRGRATRWLAAGRRLFGGPAAAVPPSPRSPGFRRSDSFTSTGPTSSFAWPAPDPPPHSRWGRSCWEAGRGRMGRSSTQAGRR